MRGRCPIPGAAPLLRTWAPTIEFNLRYPGHSGGAAPYKHPQLHVTLIYSRHECAVCLTARHPRNNIVTTQRCWKPMHVTIRQIGNSQGIVIPKPLLAQVGLEAGEAEMTIEGGALVLRKPAKPIRAGWADAARKIAQSGDDALVMGEFGNEADAELAW